MGNEGKLLTFFFIGFLLIISYDYVVDETQEVSDDDPTHDGKAMIAMLTPYLWIFFIIIDCAVCIVILSDQMN